jgi:hypothetical protein
MSNTSNSSTIPELATLPFAERFQQPCCSISGRIITLRLRRKERKLKKLHFYVTHPWHSAILSGGCRDKKYAERRGCD